MQFVCANFHAHGDPRQCEVNKHLNAGSSCFTKGPRFMATNYNYSLDCERHNVLPQPVSDTRATTIARLLEQYPYS
jgi:hypothetical protein